MLFIFTSYTNRIYTRVKGRKVESRKEERKTSKGMVFLMVHLFDKWYVVGLPASPKNHDVMF